MIDTDIINENPSISAMLNELKAEIAETRKMLTAAHVAGLALIEERNDLKVRIEKMDAVVKAARHAVYSVDSTVDVFVGYIAILERAIDKLDKEV